MEFEIRDEPGNRQPFGETKVDVSFHTGDIPTMSVLVSSEQVFELSQTEIIMWCKTEAMRQALEWLRVQLDA